MRFNKYVPLLFVILILGCTSGAGGGSGFSQTAGAVINDFSFDASQVDDATGQTVLTLTYQNVGGKTMSGNTNTYVYGAPLATSTSASGRGTVPSPSNADDRKWIVIDAGGTPGYASSTQRITYTDTSTNFMPPNPTTGQPGMSQLHRIILVPPLQDEGMNNIPYTFEARVCYPYKTTTSSTIQAIAQNTFAPVVAKKTSAETMASAGPIQISLKAGENIRINTNAGGGITTTTSATPTLSGTSLNLNNVDVLSSSATLTALTGASSGNSTATSQTITIRPRTGGISISGAVTGTSTGTITVSGGLINATGPSQPVSSGTRITTGGTGYAGTLTITPALSGGAITMTINSVSVGSITGASLSVSTSGTITISSTSAVATDVVGTSGSATTETDNVLLAIPSGSTITAGAGTTTTTTSGTPGTATMPLVFEVKDLGGGFATKSSVACNPVVDKTNAGVLDVNVYLDGTQQDCNSATTAVDAGTVYIRNGIGNLYCTGSFTNLNPKSQYQIVATTDYNYYVTKDASITVSHAKS